METYGSFAKVYDLFMDNVPYEEWSKSLIRILHSYGINDGLVLDLGCGTGKMTRLLGGAGYDMIGVDSSAEMLDAAMEKEPGDSGILYLNQDMREFELYGTVRAVVSVCDSLNYMTEEEDLQTVFSLVNNYLDPGGIFIFDLNTLYKYEKVLGEATICENRPEGSFIWENYYDKEEQINQYDLTLFIKDEDGRYSKYEETHFQRGYGLGQIKRLIEKSGLEFLACYGEDARRAPKADSERIYIVARERGKEGRN